MSARALRTFIIALGALLAAAGCGSIVGPDARTDNASLFDQVWTDFDRHYASFVIKGIDWNAIRAQYRDQAVAATTEPQLAAVIAAMFAELRDAHVDLYTRTTQYGYTPLTPFPYFFDPILVAFAYLSSSQVSDHMQFGRIGGTFGYVYVPHFSGTGWDGEMDSALEALGDIDGLIIDIRNNGGGSNETTRRIAGRFADKERLAGYSRIRNGPGHDDFTDFMAFTVAPLGGRHFGGPVVVITSPYNFSAAEDFVLRMRVLPQVTIVGDTTGGAIGYPLYRELANGWSYRFPESIEYTPERELIEDVGLAPRVFVRQTPGSLSSDEVLDAACAVLGVTQCHRI